MRVRKSMAAPDFAQALLVFARAAGKAGESWRDWSWSEAAQTAFMTVERLDSDAVEAAFAEGRREYRASAWRSVWTTAPEAYDGGGTETVERGGDFHGKALRRVLIDPRDFEYQTARYWSGLHASSEEDPRAVEAQIQETIARERAEREAREARRAAGLAWLEAASLAEIEDSDENWNAWQDRGLRTDDARAERTRRREAEEARSKALEWARCLALVPDGCALIDDGAPGYRGVFGDWVPGIPSDAWTSVRVVPGWPADDTEKASVVGEGGVQLGSLASVAHLMGEGRVRLALPDELPGIPPAAVLSRLGHRDRARIRRADVLGSTVWVGRATFGSEELVFDGAGHLVRAKNVREAAIGALRAR